MKQLVIGILGPRGRGEDHPVRRPCSTPPGPSPPWGGWTTRTPFWTRRRWSGSGASPFFPSRPCLQTPALAVTLLDTPGHVDFSSEMERTLQVLDCAILVISGTDGVQGHTLTLWRLLERITSPPFCL